MKSEATPTHGRRACRAGLVLLSAALLLLAPVTAPEAVADPRGSGGPVPRVADGIVRRGPATCKAVALTFDLCPVTSGSGFDAALVGFLREHHLHATFFASGDWMTAHEADLRGLLDVPAFEIGTHGTAHRSLPGLSPAAQRQEIAEAATALATRWARPNTLFRPPYGRFDATTTRVARELGLHTVLWSVVSGDPDRHLTAAAIEADVASRIRPGSIVIFHANGRGWHTREVIEALYQRFVVAKGYRTVTVSELLAGCPAEP